MEIELALRTGTASMQWWHAYRGQEQISRERDVRQGTKSFFLGVKFHEKAQPT